MKVTRATTLMIDFTYSIRITCSNKGIIAIMTFNNNNELKKYEFFRDLLTRKSEPPEVVQRSLSLNSVIMN